LLAPTYIHSLYEASKSKRRRVWPFWNDRYSYSSIINTPYSSVQNRMTHFSLRTGYSVGHSFHKQDIIIFDGYFSALHIK
jgi:hypothetical protein